MVPSPLPLTIKRFSSRPFRRFSVTGNLLISPVLERRASRWLPVQRTTPMRKGTGSPVHTFPRQLRVTLGNTALPFRA